MDFAIPADHRLKTKESKNIDKYLNHARELKKLWSMRVTVIPITVGALRINPKSLEKRLGKLKISERIKIIHTIALSKSARILRGVLETRRDYQLMLVWKTCKVYTDTTTNDNYDKSTRKREQVGIIQTTALLRLPGIPRRIQET